MVFIWRSEKEMFGKFWRQGNIWLRAEVTDIEGRGAYRRNRFEGGNDLIPSA